MANFQNILGVSAKELEEQFTKEETLEHLHKVYNVLFSTTNILTTALLAAKGDGEAQKLIEDLCQAEEIPEGRADWNCLMKKSLNLLLGLKNRKSRMSFLNSETFLLIHNFSD